MNVTKDPTASHKVSRGQPRGAQAPEEQHLHQTEGSSEACKGDDSSVGGQVGVSVTEDGPQVGKH